jgi:regulator of protease activity HflC (stomatin/prohibitin superfamily)
MKKVRINAGKVGLVFKNGDYQKVITEGKYWLRFSQNVIEYNLANEFNISVVAKEVLLKDTVLSEMLEIIDVNDNELVLMYENNNFKNVLNAGRYFYWKGFINRTFQKIDTSKVYITENIDKALFSNFEINKYIRLFEVATSEKAILLIDDVYTKTLTGGTYRFWKNNTTIKIAKADMRQLKLEIAGQELLTKDKASIRINFYTQYKVIDIEKALLENKDFEKQLYILMQLALRKFVGGFTLGELLENKESIANAVFEDVSKNTTKLGVKVLNCGMRDVILTGDMREIMNQVLIA